MTTFYLVGTGNTAWFLGTRLVKAGHTCKGVYGRQLQHAQQLAEALKTSVLNIHDIKDDADCCILAVTDHAVTEVAKHFAFKNTTLIHTAGSLSRMVLEPFAEHVGVLWPIYSITRDNLPKHREVPIVIKGTNDHSEGILQKLASAISDIYYTVSWEQRQWLHLCAVLSNNFVNHLMAISEQVCNKQRIPFSLLYPIVNQTTERIKHASPKALQTGPAKRGDKATIDRHLELLEGNPEWQELYKSVTTSIEKMYNPGKEE